jgi:tryptophan-rich sensory protein
MQMANTTVNVLSTQVTLSALAVAFIQKLKQWFPKLQDAPDWFHQAISTILAVLTAIGIHLSWEHGSLPGTYMMTVTGVTLVGVATGLWAVIKSVVFNELIYRTTVKKQAPGQAPQVLGVGAVAPHP